MKPVDPVLLVGAQGPFEIVGAATLWNAGEVLNEAAKVRQLRGGCDV